MKKYLFILLILLVPISVFANEDIKLNSIEVEENNQVFEKNPARIENDSIFIDLQFDRVESYIIYKVNIENKTNDNYIVDNDSIHFDSDYINYSIQCDSSNNIKPHSKNNCHIKVTYKNKVDSELLSSGIVNDNKEFNLTLLQRDLINPQTSNNIMMVLLIIAIVLFVLFKQKKMGVALILVLLLFPNKILADKKYDFIVNSNIEIHGNSRKCSHNPRNFEEYLKCMLETDLYDLHKEEYERRLNDPSAEAKILPEDMNVAKKLMDDYDYLVENLNWDYEIKNGLTKDNYKNYVDGIYYKGSLVVPFYYGEEVPNARFSIPIGFTKVKESDRVRNIQKTELTLEKVNERWADIKIPVTGDYTIFNNSSSGFQSKIEDYAINVDIQSSITIDDNGKAKFGEFPTNPENLSLVLLGGRSNIINNFIDYYVNYKRNILINNDYWSFLNYEESRNLLEQLYARGRQIGYYNCTLEDFLYEHNDLKSKELFKFIDFEYKPDDFWENEMYTGEVDQWGDPIENPAFLEEFYNYYKNNTNYIHDYDDLTFNYKGQLIEGENALYKFIGAVSGFDLSNSTNMEDDLALYIWENFQ